MVKEGVANESYFPQYNVKIKRTLRNLYQKISNRKLLDKTLKFDELFESSISDESFKVQVYEKTKSLINQTFLTKISKDQNLNVQFKSETKINSVLLYGSGWKCFTYFSALQDYWNELKIDLEKFTISIKNNFTEYGPVINYKIAILSPTILPELLSPQAQIQQADYNYFILNPNKLFLLLNIRN